jgi:hypothetical protein
MAERVWTDVGKTQWWKAFIYSFSSLTSYDKRTVKRDDADSTTMSTRTTYEVSLYEKNIKYSNDTHRAVTTITRREKANIHRANNYTCT